MENFDILKETKDGVEIVKLVKKTKIKKNTAKK